MLMRRGEGKGFGADYDKAIGPLGGIALSDTPNERWLFMNRRDTIKASLAALGGRALAGVSAPVTSHAFGAVGDGIADDTAAIQAAVDAAAAARRPLELNPGDYKVTGTVVVSTDHFQWAQPHGATIHCSNPSGPALRFAGTSRPMAFLVVDGLRAVREVSAHRRPMVEFGDSNGLSYFAIRNVFLDGQSYLGDGIHLVSVYDGSLSSVMQNNLGGVGAVFRNDPLLNVGNITFSDWANNSSPILFLIQEYYGKAHNLINSLHFDNCKHALASGGKFFAGSAGTSTEVGAEFVTVVSGQGANFTRLDWIVIIQASTGYVWADRIEAVSGDRIGLTAKLPFAVEPGDPVIVGRWHTVLGGGVSSVEVSVPHFERVNGPGPEPVPRDRCLPRCLLSARCTAMGDGWAEGLGATGWRGLAPGQRLQQFAKRRAGRVASRCREPREHGTDGRRLVLLLVQSVPRNGRPDRRVAPGRGCSGVTVERCPHRS